MSRTRVGDLTATNFYTDGDGDAHVNAGTLYVDNDGLIDLAEGGITSKVILSAVDVTLDAADSGCTVILTAADKIVTLPATIAGFECTVIVGVASGGTGAQVAPVAADQIIGNGFTPADDKNAINTGATDAVGDSFSVVGNGTTGWYVKNVIGTWAREA